MFKKKLCTDGWMGVKEPWYTKKSAIGMKVCKF